MYRALFLALVSTAAFASNTLHLKGVTTFEEYSDQSNQKGTHVFVLTFDHEVRNRGGFLLLSVEGETLRVPVKSTVGEVNGKQLAYDAATPQLEIREWETHFIDGFDEGVLREAVGQEVKLELEPTPEEYQRSISKVLDTHYLDPQYQRPGHEFAQLILQTEELPLNHNGDVRGTLREGKELKYFYFFLWPHSKGSKEEMRLGTKLFDFDLQGAELANALVGRQLAVKVTGNRPWLPLPSPFPGGTNGGCFQ